MLKNIFGDHKCCDESSDKVMESKKNRKNIPHAMRWIDKSSKASVLHKQELRKVCFGKIACTNCPMLHEKCLLQYQGKDVVLCGF